MELRQTVETTEDGSATLRSPLNGDTYHSVRGAVGEAKHVFIEAGLRHLRQTATEPVRILEMGFGTGLNAWLTLAETMHSGRWVEYTAVELYPVVEDVVAKLNYTTDERFAEMHRVPWGVWTEITDTFRLLKLNTDFADFLAEPKFQTIFDIVYYDAFAPETQPELWTEEVFTLVFARMARGGVLVTYSAKGDVKRALRAAGFEVERLPGALGKRHMLRAGKI